MSRERILRWRQEHPEEYERARESNRQAQQRPEVKEKRIQARKKWIAEHPEEHKAQQERLAEVRQSPQARKKRAESLKAWAKDHPEEAEANKRKRSAASVEKCRKAVEMCDLVTGEVIRTFKSQHEAAQWLVDNGLAKNANCVSRISAVCRDQKRKKACGYGWRFAAEQTDKTE